MSNIIERAVELHSTTYKCGDSGEIIQFSKVFEIITASQVNATYRLRSLPFAQQVDRVDIILSPLKSTINYMSDYPYPRKETAV